METIVSPIESQGPWGDESTPLHIPFEWEAEEEFRLADTDPDRRIESEVVLPRGLQRVPNFREVRILVCDSVQASVERFVAGRYAEAPEVLKVYADPSPDGMRIYVLLANDEEEALDSVFDIERWVYSRFPGEGLDFCVLPGADLEDQVPSSATLVWKRSS